MIPWHECMFEVSFTYISETTKVVRGVASSRLNAFLDGNSVRSLRLYGVEHVHTPVVPDHVRTFIRDRGLERHRLERITPRDLERYPITFVEWEGGTHLLVDGHHRYVKAGQLGHKLIKARIVPQAVWAPFEIDMRGLADGADPAVVEAYHRNSFSGIL